MPERSFGRTIRFRRTKLGLSQSKLGELVGRSPSTIRSWERDDSTPNDPDVLMALAAVLGVEQRSLFEKAGVERPEVETSPTLEQELATLRPPVVEGEGESEDRGVDISFTYEELAGLGVTLGGDEVSAQTGDAEGGEGGPEADEGERRGLEGEAPVPAFSEPRAPYVVTRLAPTRVEQGHAEPSYFEDPSERQLYRVRTVGTAVGVVVLLLLLMYALGKGIESFGEWWDSFSSHLRI